LTAPAPEHWAIAQDDGEFDAISGATVTSRAVVTAVKNTLLYFDAHRDELYTRAAEAAAATNEP
jgi:electron transport complex protein RnfG